MEVFKAIEKRHSYRGPFLSRPVKKADLRKIVQAGLLAPSGKNAQTTEFVIVDDPRLLKEIGSLHTMPAMRTAQAMIACIVDEEPEKVYEGYSFQVEDCAVAAQNMFLAMTALGYATVWIDGWLRLEGRARKIGDLLNIPQGKAVRVLLPIGIPAEPVTPKEKKPFEQRAWFNGYVSTGD
jgi:nitroreductase